MTGPTGSNRTDGQTDHERARRVAALLRAEREPLRRAWVAGMARRGMARHLEEAAAEAEWARLFDTLVECLETARYHGAQAYAEAMAERDVFRGIGAKQVIGRFLVLRDVCGRVICRGCPAGARHEVCGLDAYEAAANRMLTIVAMAFVEERERAVKQSQDLLMRQEKLASLGRLAAGVAHELNNPLSSVAGFAEALQRRAAEAGGGCGVAECQEYLALIQSEVARAAAIVRRLLDYGRQREPTAGPTDLVRVVRDAVALVDRQARLAQREIRVVDAPGPATVRGDAAMLQQVFLNLLTNALDAVEEQGDIEVAIAPAGEASVEVRVRDTGMGIAPEHAARVFDPFFTTKTVGKGTGLGLAISQSIVEQHGGTIRVESEGRGRGTTVRVRLPRMPEERA